MDDYIEGWLTARAKELVLVWRDAKSVELQEALERVMFNLGIYKGETHWELELPSKRRLRFADVYNPLDRRSR